MDNSRLKFRAWDKNKEIMTDEPFIIGNRKSSEKYYSTLHSLNIYVKQLIWMQYTGLKDKNGKEIYDSDIVKTPNGIGQVLDRLGCWFVTLQKELGYFPICDLEIIGNIYQNPELLK